MERIKLLEQNQEKILDMIKTKAPIARKSGKTGTLVYLMEKWLEIEFMKNDILEQMEEKRRKEESKKHLRYATRQELERVVKSLQDDGWSFEKVINGFLYGKIKLKGKRIDIELLFDMIEEHDGINKPLN